MVAIPWKSNAHRECALFLGACIATGAVLGVIGVLVQMAGERRGS